MNARLIKAVVIVVACSLIVTLAHQNGDVLSAYQSSSMAARPKKAKPELWRDQIMKQMQKRISFDFVDTPLPDVVAFLKNLTGINMILDTAAVSGADTPITLKETDMRLDAAMDWILRLVDLKYAIREEAIFISTHDRISLKSATLAYDLRDTVNAGSQSLVSIQPPSRTT